MNARKSLLLSMAVALAITFSAAHTAAVTLTGAVLFGSDAAGNPNGASFWNTLGGDGFFNLYVQLGGLSIVFPYANTGDGAGASISIPLAPGLNTFGIRAEPGAVPPPFFALNLFFDGDNATPGAGAVTVLNSGGVFTPNTGTTTLSLDGSSAPGPVPLAYTDGSVVVALVSYGLSQNAFEECSGNPSCESHQDQVSAFDTVPSGTPDFKGDFTLLVSPAPASVPEPSALTLVVAAVGFGGVVLRKARQLR